MSLFFTKFLVLRSQVRTRTACDFSLASLLAPICNHFLAVRSVRSEQKMAELKTLLSMSSSLTDSYWTIMFALLIVLITAIYFKLMPKKPPKSPPMVGRYIPFIGVAKRFGIEPIKLLEECKEKYGEVSHLGRVIIIIGMIIDEYFICILKTYRLMISSL